MKYEELREQVNAAMKSRDKTRLSILRQVLGDVDAWRIDNKADVVEEEKVNDIARKVLKQTCETHEASEKAGTDDERTATLAEQIEILESLLPQQLSGDDLKNLVSDIVDETGATSMKDMGKIMGELSKRTGGNFDKSAAAGFAKEIFG